MVVFMSKGTPSLRDFTMSRGGWRKRVNDDDVWGGRGGYMAAKVCKLEEQFKLEAPKQQQKEGISSNIFSGVAIYVNGYTEPTADELRRLMMLHGGQHHMYYSRSKTTHIIATNLPNSKIKELKGEKVVRPEWITDSVKAGRLLSYVQYQLYAKQKGLNFNDVCKNEEHGPGPSNIHKEFENRVNGTAKSMPDPVRNSKVNGLHGWENLEEEDEDFEFRELEPVSPVRNQKAMDRYRDPPTMANGHPHRSNGALKPLEQTLHSGKSSVDNTQCPLLDRDSIDFRDCGAQRQQHANQNSDAQSNSADAANLSSLHSIIKLNGAHHLTVQGPLHAKSTSELSPSKLSTAGLASPHAMARPGEPNFISEFYSRSRLHHISTWKCEFTDFVNTLQRQSNGLFPGREKIKKERTSLPSTDTENTGPPTPAGPQRRQTCIMHVDMDCFFVSVGIRERPDLQGKPVAVTSNRGGGKAALRPGANPELEMQYYKRRYMKNKTEEKVDFCTWENPDAARMNGVDLDRTTLSMAEIASCSYEARQAGVRNGMFFGQAKQLCPNLQSVPYDFHSYKEVALTLYETLASYTHDIEAVSCDEALVDVTDILTELGVSADCIASALRAEIKDKTKCCASIGMGSNILLARMATRKAKPDGQYYLKPEEVDDFIRDQLVTSLPGVGRSMGYKLGAMGVKTCEDLQQVPMPKLQKEFGPKTGQTLYRFSRGLDDRPVKTEKERKSVSAEINYGIRFTQTAEAEAFLLNLSEEIQRRLVAAGVKGKRLTLKVMVRKASAPVEPAKYGGHGICDNLARTVNLEQATDNSKIIGRETLKLFQMMKLNVSDVRGVGMQMQQLVPVLRTASVASSHAMAQSRSVRDLLLAQKSKRPGSLTTAAPKVHESAECCDRSSTVRNAAVLSPQKTLSTLEPMPSTSRSEPVVRYNGGLHTPPSIKTRLNLSIEIPSPSQIDHSVLEALPAEIREQVEQMCLSRSEETPNGFVTGPESLGTLILQVPEQLSQNSHSGIIVALPELSQVDPDVFSALPAELQEELKTAYNQRQRAPEVPINQQITVLTRNTHLPLKQPLTVKTKKHNKKNLVSPVKRTESPLKNKLLKSPAKSSGIRTGSPQKLIVDFLKYEESATEKLKLETGPSTSGHVPVPQEEASKVPVHQGPNLAGAFELRDIKALLKEWVTSISDPMEEDILQVVRYCTDLIEDKDLEKLDLVIKYMKRLMQQSVDSVWNMAFDFILDNIQVVIQQTYGSTLKIA
ncbi:DNA repair protein REV1-like isoform X1 [Huso huso]|uniref:DNA repair protein REV1 n=1 Tax=Huso huso TaxID=61971 RepID=A0ABR0ZKQ4_HUSHU